MSQFKKPPVFIVLGLIGAGFFVSGLVTESPVFYLVGGAMIAVGTLFK